MKSPPPVSAQHTANIRPTGLLILAALFIWADYGHHFNLNDAVYFRFDWRHLPSARVFPFVGLAALPFFAGQFFYHRRRSVALGLALVTLSTLLLFIACAAVQTDPPDVNNIALIMRSTPDNGYFTDAARVDQAGISPFQLLREYPAISPQFDGHPRNKPPGPVLFNLLLIHRLGANSSAAMFAGMTIAILAALGIPGAFAMAWRLTRNRDAAFCAAAYLSLCPALILFFPAFDQCFTLFTIGMILLWSTALQRPSAIFAAAFGLFFAAALFFTYFPVVLGIFLAGYSLRFPDRLRQIPVLAISALAAFVSFYVVLWMITRFDPIATFRTCLANQARTMHEMIQLGYRNRALPGTIPWDIYDFIRGSAWISAYLVACYLITGRNDPINWRLALLCVGQILIVAIFGLIQSETSRLWIFLLPLLMIPIGLELSRWPPWARIAAYFALLVLTAVMCQSTVFMT